RRPYPRRAGRCARRPPRRDRRGRPGAASGSACACRVRGSCTPTAAAWWSSRRSSPSSRSRAWPSRDFTAAPPRGRGPWPPGASAADRIRPAGPPQRVEWPARSIRPAVLNPQQRAAVLHDQGPLLVLAGAGSGKTRVIVEKIAHLIATGRYPARRIAAITFTNMSAKEMRERVAKRIRGDAADGLTICTFHALGLKFLQIEHEAAGLKRGFSI